MTDTVIETDGLTKVFGRRTAVRDLGLTVRRGQVYGLLGPNGAGKTTTLRLLLGLIRPTSGRLRVLGTSPGSRTALARTGMLVEGSAYYPYLCGRDNLLVFARQAGVPATMVDRVLRTVGLDDRAHDRAGSYSLGMKQRLGLAVALLKDPELLILDEPTNGLDPRGIARMRSLIRTWKDEKRTVVLCSHLLAEVEELCDHVTVLRDGVLVSQGTVEELRGATSVRISAEPVARARVIAERVVGADGIVEPVTVPGEGLEVRIRDGQVPLLARELIRNDVEIYAIERQEPTLEEIFFGLTGTEGEGAET